MNKLGRYVLKNRVAVEEPDWLAWADWMEESGQERTVAKTNITCYCCVSTVFLALDHNFSGKGPPILFETMCFLKDEGISQWRCSTWAEAQAQHEQVCSDYRRHGKN